VKELEKQIEKLNFELWNTKKYHLMNGSLKTDGPIPEEKAFDFMEMELMLRDRVKKSENFDEELKTNEFQKILEKVLPSGEARK